MLRLYVAEANPYPSRQKESAPHEWRDLQMSAHCRADQLIKASILLAHFSELEELLLEPEFEVIGKVGNGKALFEEAMRLKPDVVTDISMPVLTGIEAADQLKESGCGWYFLTVHSNCDFVRRCLSAGAFGYVV